MPDNGRASSGISQNTWIGGGIATVLVFIGGIAFSILQGALHDQSERIDKLQTIATANATSIASNAAQLSGFNSALLSLHSQFDQGRNERMSNDSTIAARLDAAVTSLNQRIDAINRDAVEIQRQVSRIEGLGDLKMRPLGPNP